MVVATDLRGVRVDVHQPLRGSGNAEQRIALRRRLRHPSANQKNEIGGFDARFQLGIDGEADFAGEIAVLAVECARASERAGHREVEAFGEPGKGGARSLRPSGPAEDGDRPLRRPEHLLQFGHLRKARPMGTGSARGASRTAAISVSMSSGSAITTGPGRPCMAM